MEELPLLVKRVIAQTVPGTLRLKVMTEGKISFLITGFPPPYRRKAGGNYLNATVDFLGIIYAIIRHPKQISKQTKSKMSHCNVIT